MIKTFFKEDKSKLKKAILDVKPKWLFYVLLEWQDSLYYF